MNKNNLNNALKKLEQQAKTSVEKGKSFEKLICAFLQQYPLYKHKFSEVWLWDDWPQRQGRDTGIDLVAQTVAGELYAIQCKFYHEDYELKKGDIDSFLNELGKKDFAKGIIFSTTSKWSVHAEKALQNRSKECQRVDLNDLERFNVNWENLLTRKQPFLPLKQLRPHQRDALQAVMKGFKNSDIGKLIMPCGTGKTFTALKIAEKMVAPNGVVLVLMPSLSLVSQTLQEWSQQAQRPLQISIVCSDSKVGKNDEDIHTYDLALSPTTDPQTLADEIQKSSVNNKNTMKVIFSTYQSIQVVADAQKGMSSFDFVICDEAHRTTGVEDQEGKLSPFTKIHDRYFIKANKRLFMTATPRIYGDKPKKKAKEYGVEIFSMDDEEKYGKEFYRLSFSEAIKKGLLSDYKVCVFAVVEEELDMTMRRALAQDDSVSMDNVAKIVGCWNALAKRSVGNKEYWGDLRPAKRAVAFSGTIKRSLNFQAQFNKVIESFKDNNSQQTNILNCDVHHVDGKQNALLRNKELRWLKNEPPENECRILSNARCLSEGVDVPALDAVLFLNPRRSEIDVVQSVGRVMRKAEGKEYGYIILPIIIPKGVDVDKELNSDSTYAVIWQILRALRAHDDRFDTMINQLELNKKPPSQLIFCSCHENFTQPPELAFNLEQTKKLREAVLARLVIKCGDRQYWKKWAKDIKETARIVTNRIAEVIKETRYQSDFEKFLHNLQHNLNPAVDKESAVDMLAQHMITKPIFVALFNDYSFVRHNPVAKSMERMVQLLQNLALAETKDLNQFYASIKRRVDGIDNAEAKEKIMKELYNDFFKQAFPKMADRLGIVYTPTEVVDFILHSSDHILRQEFGEGLTDKDVHIIDPFLGTGTFIVRLLQSNLIRDKDLQHKYRQEIHANEIVLLAYYIGAINIEQAYHYRKQQAGLSNDYETFKGIVLTDTFQIGEHGELIGNFFAENKEQIERQTRGPIKVIVGNPPWSVGQRSENDANKNLKYAKLDERIESSYIKPSNANLSKGVYDSYVRAIRWASDRIGDNGIVSFVTNGNFIETPSMDGLRCSLAKEFSSVHVIDLKGDLRRGGKEAGQSIFPIQTPVAISFLVKNSNKTGCKINYYSIGDFLSGAEKLKKVEQTKTVVNIKDWQHITPSKQHTWLNQRDPLFAKFIPMENHKKETMPAVFNLCSLGVVTNRDPWVYNYDRQALANNVKCTINFYNSELARWQAREQDVNIDAFVIDDHQKISWSAGVKQDLKREKLYEYNNKYMRISLYRPFCKQKLFYYKPLNERHCQTPKVFPLSGETNLAICVSMDRNNWLPLMCDTLPDLNMLNTKIFPRYRYDDGEKIDNINPYVVRQFQQHYHDKKIDADALFYFIYGLLHSKEYRERYKNNLRLDTPRIPYVNNFWQFERIGRKLADLHVNYERVKKYPLKIKGLEQGNLQVQKMKHPKKNKVDDLSTIIYNDDITISGIPEEAYRYEVAGRSAVWWIMNRYQIKTDKKSGIVNDPNKWSNDPRYTIDLLARVVTVSVESYRLIDELANIKKAA